MIVQYLMTEYSCTVNSKGHGRKLTCIILEVLSNQDGAPTVLARGGTVVLSYTVLPTRITAFSAHARVLAF